MATNLAIAIRRTKAQDRLDKAARRIGRVAGIDAPDLNARARQPGMAEAMRLEALADYMTAVAEALYQTDKELDGLAAEAKKTTAKAPESADGGKDTKSPKKGG